MFPLNFVALPRSSILNSKVHPTLRNRRRWWSLAAVLLMAPTLCVVAQPAFAAGSPKLPEIRMHRGNGVPACVTPDRLMAFLKMRNGNLSPRYRDIAKWYRHHGEAWRVRWDFAFYQMALETNFLSYRRGNGEPGDVKPEQNNFAGIGATGGGVAGDRFANVSTGVLAQIQHLVAYSGEPVDRPVAARTALKQNDIVSTMRRLNRPPRFSDLARRWAADARYANSIAAIAESFARTFCEEAQRQRAADNSALSAWPPPTPNTGAKARANVVAKTVWRRGDTPPKQPTEPVAITPPPLPQATPRSSEQAEAAADTATGTNGILSGLQSMAKSMRQNLGQWPAALQDPPAIIAPSPRPADRVPRVASRQ